MDSVLIIGAGMCGIAAARVLKEQGKTVTLIDKGRAIGGRMMTRSFRIEGFGDAIGDRGAQYCTARDSRFQELIDSLKAVGVVKEWTSPDAKHSPTPRYIGTKGMVSIAQYLSQGLDIRVDQKVARIVAADGRWTAFTEDEMSVSADALIITSPVPQSLAILDASGVHLSSEERYALERIQYHPCIALMTLLTDDSLLSSHSARLQGDVVWWVADNQRKGISSLPVMTLHAAPEFSSKHWHDTDESIAEVMMQTAKPFLGSAMLMYKVHRWRYSRPFVMHSEPFLRASNVDNPPLLFAGDGFTDGRVEGAYLSGIAAAQALLA
jgi:predicted NAD/FAD-dependent oxidoreductase